MGEQSLISSIEQDPVFAASVVDSLLPLLRQPDPHLRGVAVNLLGHSGSPRALDALLPLSVTETADEVIRAIIAALARWHDPRVLPAVQRYAGNADVSIRSATVYALDALRDQRALPTLRALANDADDDCRALATVALANLGDAQGLEGLLAYLHEDNMQIRAGAAVALGGLKNSRTVLPLIAALDDPALPPASNNYQGDDNFRYGVPRVTAAIALGQIGDRRAVAPLIAMLDRGDIICRAAAAKSLGLLKDPRAIPALLTALDRFAGRAQSVPAEALKAITGQDFGTDAGKWRDWWEKQERK